MLRQDKRRVDMIIDMCDDNIPIITNSFDDFATRSFEFLYLWFYRAQESA